MHSFIHNLATLKLVSLDVSSKFSGNSLQYSRSGPGQGEKIAEKAKEKHRKTTTKK